jgi:hypothetical protein
MATLHGSWIPQKQTSYFFIWGEIWRALTSVETKPTPEVAAHPFAMTRDELTAFLRDRHLPLEPFFAASDGSVEGSHGSDGWQAQVVVLPTQKTKKATHPVLSTVMQSDATDTPSAELHPWQVEGFCLTPLAAVEFLQALPLSSLHASNNYLGGELRYWSQVCRWSLDLLTRGKFIPGVYRQPDGAAIACWQPLLDSGKDQGRLEQFTRTMPSACRAYGEQRGRGAEEQGSRGAEEQGSRGAGEQRSRGAEAQGSRGAEEQGSRGAGEQRSRGAEEQLTIVNYQLSIINSSCPMTNDQ